MIIPGNSFGDYLLFICRLLGRYGSGDGDVMLAMLPILALAVVMRFLLHFS